MSMTSKKFARECDLARNRFSRPAKHAFLAIAALALSDAVMHAIAGPAAPSPADAEVQAFLDKWDSGWTNHDAQALSALHTEDSVTVTRFGHVIVGRAAEEQALVNLHKKGGLFNQATFAKQQLIHVNRTSNGVVIVQTKWQTPEVGSDNHVHLDITDDIVLTFVLVKRGAELQILEIDSHGVPKKADR